MWVRMRRYSGSSTTNSVHSTQRLRDKELLHGHGVHGGEVFLDHVWTMWAMVISTEVQFQVQGVFIDPKRVIHVGFNKFKAFNAFIASKSKILRMLKWRFLFYV